jgi:hypothetical protein
MYQTGLGNAGGAYGSERRSESRDDDLRTPNQCLVSSRCQVSSVQTYERVPDRTRAPRRALGP